MTKNRKSWNWNIRKPFFPFALQLIVDSSYQNQELIDLEILVAAEDNSLEKLLSYSSR
eukprot:UN06565